MADIRLVPPDWCADAVATNEGWRDPKTSELLVSLPGLLRFQEEYVAPEAIVTEQLEVEVPLIDETVIPEVESLTEPVESETVEVITEETKEPEVEVKTRKKK